MRGRRAAQFKCAALNAPAMQAGFTRNSAFQTRILVFPAPNRCTASRTQGSLSVQFSRETSVARRWGLNSRLAIQTAGPVSSLSKVKTETECTFCHSNTESQMAGRWCVPPAILHDPNRTLDATGILEECAGDLGLLLWRTVRDVELWANTPHRQRSALFADGSADVRLAQIAGTDVPSAVAAFIGTINEMLILGSRGDASSLTVSCLEVARWARSMSHVETAVAFSQAGALASPLFSEAALQTGISAVDARQAARGETWLRRAVAVARYERNRPAYAGALVELGILAASRGDTVRAERLYRKAFAAGRRFSDRQARARAAHRLFRLAIQREDGMEAAQFALAAQRAFLSGTQSGPLILFDLGRFWSDLARPAPAFGALRRLWSVREQLPSQYRLVAAALTARCCPKDQHVLRGVAVEEAWLWMDGDVCTSDESRLTAALHLAHAARMTGDLAGFSRAKRVVLALAPRELFQHIAAQVSEMWPDGGVPARAS